MEQAKVLEQAKVPAKVSEDAVLKRASDLRTKQLERMQLKRFNGLVLGQKGTGKTRLLSTCRLPVCIDSFDPFGTQTAALRPFIERGDIIVCDYEYDDWNNPVTYDRWSKDFTARKREGFFDRFATYALDSLSGFVRYVLYYIIKLSGHQKTDKTPGIADYQVLYMTMMDELNEILQLPCDVIVTGHLQMEKDDLLNTMVAVPNLTPKLSVEVPSLFLEQWLTRIVKGAKDDEYKLQVKPDGVKWHAETRIGEFKFNTYEEPNIKMLLKKVGYDVSDKPKLF